MKNLYTHLAPMLGIIAATMALVDRQKTWVVITILAANLWFSELSRKLTRKDDVVR